MHLPFKFLYFLTLFFSLKEFSFSFFFSSSFAYLCFFFPCYWIHTSLFLLFFTYKLFPFLFLCFCLSIFLFSLLLNMNGRILQMKYSMQSVLFVLFKYWIISYGRFLKFKTKSNEVKEYVNFCYTSIQFGFRFGSIFLSSWTLLFVMIIFIMFFDSFH